MATAAGDRTISSDGSLDFVGRVSALGGHRVLVTVLVVSTIVGAVLVDWPSQLPHRGLLPGAAHPCRAHDARPDDARGRPGVPRARNLCHRDPGPGGRAHDHGRLLQRAERQRRSSPSAYLFKQVGRLYETERATTEHAGVSGGAAADAAGGRGPRLRPAAVRPAGPGHRPGEPAARQRRLLRLPRTTPSARGAAAMAAADAGDVRRSRPRRIPQPDRADRASRSRTARPVAPFRRRRRPAAPCSPCRSWCAGGLRRPRALLP